MALRRNTHSGMRISPPPTPSMSTQPPARKRSRHQVTPPPSSTALPTPSFPTRSGSPTLTDYHSEGSITAENHGPILTGEESINQCQVTSIDTLPDDVLLAIFNYCVDHGYDRWNPGKGEKEWQSLVHVCRRWRIVMFGSPRYLNLQLVCTTGRRGMLDVWPALPLIIWRNAYSTGSMDNIIAGLQRSDLVREIHLKNIQGSEIEVFLAEMQKPFPELTYLDLWSTDKVVPVDPDSFLGGSAPHLQFLALHRFQFLGLPKLLLSTTHLATLYLYDIPHSGYISPNAMVTVLSTLTSLERLSLGFHSPRSCPDWASRYPPPSTRSILPVLTLFWFKGVSEYLEDLVTCIDTPQLNDLGINFFNDTIFDMPQFVQFINRTPSLGALEKAHIVFWEDCTITKFSSQTSGYRKFEVQVLCKRLDWQVSFLEQLCTSCLPSLSMLQDLYIYQFIADWKDSIEKSLWLELLHPFTAVKNLYLSKKLAPLIVPALQELVGGRMTVVLPALENFFLEGLESSGPVHEGIGQFVAARQSADHPIAISSWTDSAQVGLY